MNLQVQRTSVRSTADEVNDLRPLWILDVEDGNSFIERMTDEGMATMHHDLNTVGLAGHIRVPNKRHMVCADRATGIKCLHVRSPTICCRFSSAGIHCF